MSDRTKAELADALAEEEARATALARRLREIDTEAAAYSACVKALTNLTKDSGSYASSNKTPDKDAIGRVLDSLTERFGIVPDSQPETHNTFYEPEWESIPDPRDNIIGQLIDALRKS